MEREQKGVSMILCLQMNEAFNSKSNLHILKMQWFVVKKMNLDTTSLGMNFKSLKQWVRYVGQFLSKT
jgi:hypothetical protein